MERDKVYLSLGSNVGRRRRNLQAACRLLGRILDEPRSSRVYETEPLYVRNQRRFLNMVLEGRTALEPQVLLRETQAVETRLGRTRSPSNRRGPRTIDIDILLYGARIVRDENLTIPHPGIEERQFVLIPLLELAPQLRHPQTGIPLRDVSARLPPQGVYIYREGNYNTHSQGARTE